MDPNCNSGRRLDDVRSTAPWLNLFVTSGITGMSVMQVVRAAYPWLPVLLVFLVIVTYIPQLSVWLPNWLF